MDNKDAVIIGLGVLLAFFILGGTGYRMMGYGYSPYSMMYGYGFSWMWIFMAIFSVAIILLIIWLIKQISSSNSSERGRR